MIVYRLRFYRIMVMSLWPRFFGPLLINNQIQIRRTEVMDISVTRQVPSSRYGLAQNDLLMTSSDVHWPYCILF